MVPSTTDAVAASVACGEAVGLVVDRPEVIAEGYSVRVRLHPTPVVTRVVTEGRTLRPDPLPWLQREVDVAGFLVAAGAPVVPAWSEPGPYVVGGLEVSLWTWVEQVPGESPAAWFGGMLGALHKTLLGHTDDLPLLVGPLTDIVTALEASEDPTLHRAAAELLPLAATWPRRPLHGDAHLGNLLRTRDGVLWTDFEDVCAGPVEWDLASTTVTRAMVADYPEPVDRSRLRDCRDLRRLQILASLRVAGADEPALEARLVGALRRRWTT